MRALAALAAASAILHAALPLACGRVMAILPGKHRHGAGGAMQEAGRDVTS